MWHEEAEHNQGALPHAVLRTLDYIPRWMRQQGAFEGLPEIVMRPILGFRETIFCPSRHDQIASVPPLNH